MERVGYEHQPSQDAGGGRGNPEIDVPVRGIIDVSLTRVQRSCGWAVPNYEYAGDRDVLRKHNAKRTQAEFMARRIQSNASSIDGLPGLESSD